MKFKVKLKSLAETVPPTSSVKEAPQKAVVRYPELTISSDQFEGVKDLQLNQTVTLTATAKVIQLRGPEEYEVRNGQKDKTDVIARLSLLKGAISKSALPKSFKMKTP